MSLSGIFKILRSLNGGSIIPLINDEVSFCNISSDIVNLYLGNGNKYYYFSEYVQTDEVDNMSTIEQVILYNDGGFNHIVKPDPQHAYLILFYKVDTINDSILKKAIDFEENEYFYKKYVFYYTQKEFDSFILWYDSQKFKTINELINSSNIADNMDKDYVRFLLRLLVKIPFIKFDFKIIELKDFSNSLNVLISRMRNSEIISTLNKDLCNLIDSDDFDIDKVVDKFYNEKVGE